MHLIYKFVKADTQKTHSIAALDTYTSILAEFFSSPTLQCLLLSLTAWKHLQNNFSLKLRKQTLNVCSIGSSQS